MLGKFANSGKYLIEKQIQDWVPDMLINKLKQIFYLGFNPTTAHINIHRTFLDSPPVANQGNCRSMHSLHDNTPTYYDLCKLDLYPWSHL